MVSIESRLTYSEELRKNKKAEAFMSFTSLQNINVVPQGANATEQSYFNAINSILNSNNTKFSTIYNEFATREPDSQSPFVHDDFLLFVLVCGIKKFSLTDEWIVKVLNCRNDSEPESKSIKTTLYNILKDNFQSTDNLFEVIIVFQNVIEKSIVGLTSLNNTLIKITTLESMPPYKSAFLNVITFRAYDLIILSKKTPSSTQFNDLRDFEKTFTKRALLISKVLYFVMIVFLIWLGYYLIGYTDKIKDELNSFSIIFQLLGVALIGSLNKFFINCFFAIIKYCFGYKITKINSK